LPPSNCHRRGPLKLRLYGAIQICLLLLLLFFDPGTPFPRNEKITLCNIKLLLLLLYRLAAPGAILVFLVFASSLCRQSSQFTVHWPFFRSVDADCFYSDTGNESAPIQLTQCYFPGLAVFDAKIQIYFSNKIYGNPFVRQHSETITVSNYQNADCSLKKK